MILKLLEKLKENKINTSIGDVVVLPVKDLDKIISLAKSKPDEDNAIVRVMDLMNNRKPIYKDIPDYWEYTDEMWYAICEFLGVEY